MSIWVIDRGPGVAAEHLPRLFDEFYQIRKLDGADTQGVGLGLSIVRRLGALMGLAAEIHSRPGYGTAVAIHGLTPTVVAVRETGGLKPSPRRGGGWPLCGRESGSLGGHGRHVLDGRVSPSP